MPESLCHRYSELAPASDGEDNQGVPREVDIAPRPHDAVPSKRELPGAEELQVVVRTRRGGRSSHREQQSNQVGSGNRREDRLKVAEGPDPQGLILGIARRFEITQTLARDGVDSMYMEDVTRLGGF